MQFSPSEKQPVTKCDVVINGKKWGTVWDYTSEIYNHKFQCQLNFKHCFNPGGFGETMEEAVKDTIQNAHAQLAEMKADFDAFLSEVTK